MAAQVRDVVRAALGHLRVIDSHATVAAADMRDAIRALNLLARDWESLGIAIGWSDVSAPDDPLPSPEAEGALGYNLALRLRASYGVVLDADVVALANDTLAVLTTMCTATEFLQLTYPDLPAGTGQRCGSWRDGLAG